MLLRASDRGGPGFARRRISCVERSEIVEVAGVVGGEWSDPPESAQVDAATGGHVFSGWHDVVLSQSPLKHVKASSSGSTPAGRAWIQES